MRKRYITIKDIARELGISVSTVSRALRDTYDVSQETRDKVLAKAEELNYKPNFNATGLVQNSTRKIGILIPSITNYYFSTVITGIQEMALENGFTIVLYITNDAPEIEAKMLRELTLSSLDGLLVCITSKTESQERFAEVIEEGLPVVFFDRIMNMEGTSKVMQGDQNGAFKAVEHLVGQGYKRIAHITGPEGLLLTQNRFLGYQQALEHFQLPFNPDWIIHSGFSRNHGKDDMRTLLNNNNRPDAVFAVCDPKAIGALLALKEAGIVPGRDIGVIGFTNDPMGEVVSPTLTTIAEPAYEIGRRSCELLLKHIRKSNFTGEEVILPCHLIERQSTVRA